ncbi:hypothetical protein SAMN05216266_10195 [Amycolatopsis marina]|uniref:LPXTG-motif cell wall anchor domain-containing protein n=1 Tax=Amycolatopsis marina TaxID=490629 RepID=A0A1I0V9P4_9PSEU|nr:hypothetical protein [Amycolatopsis marina]SFA72962.1 hypothetical protein SAMN05216266_10195 [Amycolatopsis marina]
MKPWLLLTAGILLLTLGAIWGLQGIGVITGSPMTGQKLWFGIGLVCAVAGLALMAAGTRRTSR